MHKKLPIKHEYVLKLSEKALETTLPVTIGDTDMASYENLEDMDINEEVGAEVESM